jgi:predicted GNAT family acetyltransferase
MRIRIFKVARDFLSRAGQFLEANEAANSLILGIVLRIRDYPERVRVSAFLAAVEDRGEVILVAVMTPPHPIVLSYSPGDTGPAVDRLVDYLSVEGPPVPGVLGPRRQTRRFAKQWTDTNGGRFQLAREQRIHSLEKVSLPTLTAEGRLRQAREEEQDLLTRWRQAFAQEALEGESRAVVRSATAQAISDGRLFVWDAGRPVSMAMKTRPTRHGISISLVYTPPEFRRQGYATACVAELSRLLLAEGRRFCALYTDLANPTSNHIYWQIGYRPLCDVDHIGLEP